MIIPCIDLMDGQVVQLRQGREKVLERGLDEMLELFEPFPLIHVIDLDGAIGSGSNHSVVTDIIGRRQARVGGGIRTVAHARELIDAGAQQVIVGSAAFTQDGLAEGFLGSLAEAIGVERVIVAVDSLGGRVAVNGWRKALSLSPLQALQMVVPFCGGLLCTNVDDEGMMRGTNIDLFRALRSAMDKTVIAAGGITTKEDVVALISTGIEVALGMAVYTGALELADLIELMDS